MGTLDRREPVTVDLCVCPVLGIELRASHVIGEHYHCTALSAPSWAHCDLNTVGMS